MKTYLNCHIVTNHLQQYLQFSAKLKSSKNCQVQIYSNKPIASHSVSKDVLTSLCLLRYIMDVNRRHAWDLTVSSVMQEGDFLWCGSLKHQSNNTSRSHPWFLGSENYLFCRTFCPTSDPRPTPAWTSWQKTWWAVSVASVSASGRPPFTFSRSIFDLATMSSRCSGIFN